MTTRTRKAAPATTAEVIERQRRDDDERAIAENDEQRDYAEERFNAALMEEE